MSETPPEYLLRRCEKAVEVGHGAFDPCALTLGHDGPCFPEPSEDEQMEGVAISFFVMSHPSLPWVDQTPETQEFWIARAREFIAGTRGPIQVTPKPTRDLRVENEILRAGFVAAIRNEGYVDVLCRECSPVYNEFRGGYDHASKCPIKAALDLVGEGKP